MYRRMDNIEKALYFMTDINFFSMLGYLFIQETEVNKVVHNFELIFSGVLNKHASVKEKRIKTKYQTRKFK